MKINVLQPILDYKGEPIKREKEDFKIREAISGAVNSVDPKKPMTAEDKSRAYQISIKIYANKETNLTVDEMAFIKKRAGEVYGPLTYGRLCDLFDKPEEKTPDVEK